jgi:hypothetical protein
VSGEGGGKARGGASSGAARPRCIAGDKCPEGWWGEMLGCFRNDLDRGGGERASDGLGRLARWRRRMRVSWKTITLHFSYARRRRLFSHQVWVSCIRARS